MASAPLPVLPGLLLLLLLLGGGGGGASSSSSPRCQRITAPACLDLGYNATAMPNVVGHEDQREAATQVGPGWGEGWAGGNYWGFLKFSRC